MMPIQKKVEHFQKNTRLEDTTHFMIVEGKKIEDGVGRTYDELVGKVKELTSGL